MLLLGADRRSRRLAVGQEEVGQSCALIEIEAGRPGPNGAIADDGQWACFLLGSLTAAYHQNLALAAATKALGEDDVRYQPRPYSLSLLEAIASRWRFCSAEPSFPLGAVLATQNVAPWLRAAWQ